MLSVGDQFKILVPWYGKKEVLTVTAIDDGVTCTTSRFPGTTLFFLVDPIEAYGDKIQMMPTESDYRRAADLAETAIRVSPQGSHVRFEEVQEQGVVAA